MELINKAYTVNFDKILYGWEYDPNYYIAYGDRNSARQDLLRELRYEDLKLTNKDTVDYLNIPVKRIKKFDKFLFEGEEKTTCQIEQIKEERKRFKELDDILENSSIKYCYILKRGVYYRPNSSGYTQYKAYAGVYTKEEAVRSSKSCHGDLRIVPIDIEKHNKMITDKIEDLKTRLI